MLGPAIVLFAILVAHSLLETARDALFLAKLGPHLLAAAYIAMAACALVSISIVRRWHRVRDPRRMLIAFLVLATAGTLVVAATVASSSTVVFAFYVWTGFVVTLVVPSFWTALDRSLRIAEAKRMFGAIGAGGVLGALVGSATASALGHVLAARHLVTAGGIASGVATIVAIALMPRRPAAELVPRRSRVEALSRGSRRYLELLVGVGLVSMIVLTLGDLTFKRVIAERLPASDLATTFGAIYAVLNAIGLAIQVVVTPRLLARWGVGAALTVLPVILVLTAMGFVLTGATTAVIALKLGDGSLRHSLHRVGSEILYLPLPSAVRDGGKLVADAIGQRGGQALAAVIVLVLGAAGGGDRALGSATAIAGLAWLAFVVVARRAYLAQFRDTLQAGEIQRDVALPQLDAESLALLADRVTSSDEIEALAALDLLARRARVPATAFRDPRERVVRHALSLLHGELPSDTAAVLVQLLEHREPHIRAAALAAAIRVDGDRERLVAALADPAREVRAVALVALALDGDANEDGIAELLAGTTADRIALADAIAFMPHPRFQPLIYQLLDHGEPSVMRRVLEILSRAPELAEVDRLVALIADSRVRADVRRALRAVGGPALDALIAALDDPATDPTLRSHLPRTISRFHSATAAGALAGRLPHEPDRRTEHKLLRALGRMRADDPRLPVDPAPLREYLRRVVREAARYGALADYLVATGGTASGTVGLILELLLEKRRIAIDHAFRVIGILHPLAGLRSAHDAFTNGDDARRSAAREIVEAFAPTDVRAQLLATIDGQSSSTPTFSSYEAFITALLSDPSESLRCVVAHHVAERHLTALRGELIRLRPLEGQPLVAHAFDRALEVLR